jgi:large subunit ribosomal protein L13
VKTYSPKPEHIVRRWYVIDASGQVLGRLASEVAAILRGKHKPIFAPHMDTGDNVIVVNADKVELTGGKEAKKISYRHSGYPGGIKGTRYDVLLAERPVFVVEKAIRGMLPKNSLGRSMIKKLHVVVGPEHRHQAQQPVAYTLGRPPIWEGLPQGSPRANAVATAPAREKPAAKKPPARPRPDAKATATSGAKETTARKPTARKTTATAAKRSAARKPIARKTGTEKTPAKSASSKPRARKSATKDEEES